MYRKIEISQQTVLFTLAILAGIWLVLQIRDILFLVFIAFLLMTAIYPLVAWLEKIRLPRAVSILLVYVVVLGLLGVAIGSAIPGIVSQTSTLAATLPEVTSKVLPYWNVDIRTMTQQIGPLSENVLQVTLGIFSNLVTTFTVLVFTFYFILERGRAESTLTDLFGTTIGKQATDILRVIERKLGYWVRGELLLMTIIGVLTYIGLTLLHIDFALPLAIIAGLLEIVPMIGPVISAVPAVLLALAVSPILALSVAILYFAIQQLENNVFVPLIMKRSVGLSPIITILALMIGARFGGLIGAILAVPTVVVLQVLFTTLVGNSGDLIEKRTKNPSK